MPFGDTANWATGGCPFAHARLGNCRLPKSPGRNMSCLMQRVKDESARLWYIRATLENGWSRNTLAMMIDTHAYDAKGKR